MILKKQESLPNRKSSPFVGILLFIVSLVLLILTGPLGFLYGILYSLFTKGFRGIGEYLLKIAVSIDQLGNVLMQHLLNTLWVKKEVTNLVTGMRLSPVPWAETKDSVH